MYIRRITEPRLAHNAYLVGCPQTRQAILVDPQRDVDRYLRIAAGDGYTIAAATETHIHADYLSGLLELAAGGWGGGGIEVCVSDEGDADWKYLWVEGSCRHRLLRHGDRIEVGSVVLEAMSSPGHTPEHLSFLVWDGGDESRPPIGLLSGDFVFVGDVGRPDLLETAAGQRGAMRPAARELFRSLRMFEGLPGFVQVWPGHGAGSACGKALGSLPTSTVGYELLTNASLLRAAGGEEGFVKYILEGQPEPPPYFARMKRQNREGPPRLPEGALPAPPPLPASRLAELAGNLEIALIDTRPWDEFREGHVPGAYSMPLNKAFPTNAGSYVDPATPIYLVAAPHDLDEAVRSLVRVGLDRIEGTFPPESIEEYGARGGGALRASRQIDAAGARKRLEAGGDLLLDVRRGSEFATGSIDGAENIAHTSLAGRLGELPRDRGILVYCQLGERSGYACALLERHGFSATHLSGGIREWKKAFGDR